MKNLSVRVLEIKSKYSEGPFASKNILDVKTYKLKNDDHLLGVSICTLTAKNAYGVYLYFESEKAPFSTCFVLGQRPCMAGRP